MTHHGNKNHKYDKLFDLMENQLIDLAGKWRGIQDRQLINEYQIILNCMLDLGWNEYLDVDAELPQRYMPERYFNRHRPTPV